MRAETNQDQVKAFLDAYARICEQHGLAFTGRHECMWIEALSSDGVTVVWDDGASSLEVLETSQPRYDLDNCVSSVRIGGAV